MSRRKKHILGWLFVFIWTPSSIFADPELQLDVFSDGKQVGMAVSLSLDDIREMLSIVRDGATYKITFEVELIEKGTGLIDTSDTLIKITKHRELSYDTVKRKYIVKEGKHRFTFASSSALIRFAFSLKRDVLAANLTPGQTYIIKARARGKSIELYFPLSLVVDWFTKIYNFETGWKGEEFKL